MLHSRSPAYVLVCAYESRSTAKRYPYYPEHHFTRMDRQKIIYFGLWCILLVITGFLIWIIKLVSGSSDQVLIIIYYGCAMAVVIALCLLILAVAKFKTKEP